MTEGMEHAFEYVTAGILFCMAVAMLLWLHGAFLQQLQVVGKAPERLIMLEQEGR